MAKFYGAVGFETESETAPGVWSKTTTERNYSGDIIRNVKRIEPGVSTNDNLVVNNQISIVADAYASNHFFAIKYAKWMGVNWKVKSVDVQRPRLILTLGEIYNG